MNEPTAPTAGACEAKPADWPNYRDMTSEQMLAWGAAEHAARTADLAEARSAEGLKLAQEAAERRRKAIGASRSAAASMVLDSSRAKRWANGGAA